MTTNYSSSRRNFLKQTSILTAGIVTLGIPHPVQATKRANDKIILGVIGCNNRGMDHINGFLSIPNTEIAYICDVDSRALQKGLAAAAKKQPFKPEGVNDLRRILDDPKVDAVSIATPNHWHAPATILACAAGKHVYVEKPGSHNPREGELIVAAARKHKRVVQMGSQRRSWAWMRETMAALHAGELGKVTLARGWFAYNRQSIGRGRLVSVPDWLDYSLWQGPAPEQPFKDNLIHYNWHFHWHWGNGEIGNNGVHAIDLARWGLGVDYPRRVTFGGNRYRDKDDDKQTPDTGVATFDFGDAMLVWEGQSYDPHGFEDSGFGVNFYGEKGALTIAGNDGGKIYDLKQKLVREIPKVSGDNHFKNFLDGIREGTALNAEIEEGQKSTLLCHLANISWRTGHTLDFDPKRRKIVGDHTASKLWGRSYRKGWEPKI